MIFFMSLFLDDPKKVLLGKWKGDKFDITINQIKNNKVFGVYKTDTRTINFTGTYIESIWDQPCSKAYDCEFLVGSKKLNIKFIGYEKQSEVNDCLICEGDLNGLEAQVIDRKGITFLYKR
jgi:hypothetical protein